MVHYDNFLESYDELREFADNATYDGITNPIDGVVYPGICLELPERPEIEFLSGGGGGTEGNTQINQKKARMMMNRAPAVKLASNAQSNISIPNTTSTLATSKFSVISGQMSGTPGSGGGFGGGHGTGLGRGTGPGVGPGTTAGFVAMFGKKIEARKLAVVLDVSGSMHGFPLEVTKTLMRNLLSSLRPTDTFNVILFAGNSLVLSEHPLPATEENTSCTSMVFCCLSIVWPICARSLPRRRRNGPWLPKSDTRELCTPNSSTDQIHSRQRSISVAVTRIACLAVYLRGRNVHTAAATRSTASSESCG